MSDFLRIEPTSRIAEAQKHVSGILYGLEDLFYHVQILRSGSFNFISNDPQLNIYNLESTLNTFRYSNGTMEALKGLESILDLELRRRNGGI
jgi:hypothetical protein